MGILLIYVVRKCYLNINDKIDRIIQILNTVPDHQQLYQNEIIYNDETQDNDIIEQKIKINLKTTEEQCRAIKKPSEKRCNQKGKLNQISGHIIDGYCNFHKDHRKKIKKKHD